MTLQFLGPGPARKQGNLIDTVLSLPRSSKRAAKKQTTQPGTGEKLTLSGKTAPKKAKSGEPGFLKRDTTYLSELAALNAQKGAYASGVQSQKASARASYLAALQGLGWDNGQWSKNDRTTAYGAAYNSTLGDNAARGMLQSTAFDQNLTDMLAGFNRKRGELATQQQSALTGLDADLAIYDSEIQQKRNQAKVSALARRAAQIKGTK